MKKWLMIIAVLIVGIAACPIDVKATEIREGDLLEEEEVMPEADTEIIFDADAAINKSAAKSALADMHGVFVFRDAFITREKLVKESEKREREKIERLILTSSQPEPAYEEWVDYVLTADMNKVIKDVYYKEENSNLFLWIYCGMVSICILCGAIALEDYLKKKKRRKMMDDPMILAGEGDNFGEGRGMD